MYLPFYDDAAIRTLRESSRLFTGIWRSSELRVAVLPNATLLARRSR
jgi:hypothetical protein